MYAHVGAPQNTRSHAVLELIMRTGMSDINTISECSLSFDHDHMIT